MSPAMGLFADQLTWAHIESAKRLKIGQQMIILGTWSNPNMPIIETTQINYILALGRLAISKYKHEQNVNVIEIYKTDSFVREVWKDFR